MGKLSDATRTGVGRLQRSMHRAVSGLGQFRVGRLSGRGRIHPAVVEELDSIAVSSRVYREEDMSALRRHRAPGPRCNRRGVVPAKLPESEV